MSKQDAKSKKYEVSELLHKHNIRHRIEGGSVYLNLRNYISLPEDVTAALVTLCNRYQYVIQLQS